MQRQKPNVQKSNAKKICEMLERGHSTKDIVTKLKVPAQQVYTQRYLLNKARGLGSIGAGTGINAGAQPESNQVWMYRSPNIPKPEPEVPQAPQRKATLWQRIVGFITGR